MSELYKLLHELYESKQILIDDNGCAEFTYRAKTKIVNNLGKYNNAYIDSVLVNESLDAANDVHLDFMDALKKLAYESVLEDIQAHFDEWDELIYWHITGKHLAHHENMSDVSLCEDLGNAVNPNQ